MSVAPVQFSSTASPLLPVAVVKNGSSTAGSSTTPTPTTVGAQGSPTTTSPPIPRPADSGSPSQPTYAYNPVGSVTQPTHAKKSTPKSSPSYDKPYRRQRRQTQSGLMQYVVFFYPRLHHKGLGSLMKFVFFPYI